METVQQAVNAANEGMALSKASIMFSIPRTTLMRRVKSDKIPTSLGRYAPVFSRDFENELLMHVVEMQNRFYGLSLHDLRSIAYELAVRNGLAHPFSTERKLAGIEWARSFMALYPELALKKPEATSMSRLTGFNKVQVNRFFDLLKSELGKKKFTASQVFNVNETCITTVHTPGKNTSAQR